MLLSTALSDAMKSHIDVQGGWDRDGDVNYATIYKYIEDSHWEPFGNMMEKRRSPAVAVVATDTAIIKDNCP